MIEWIRDVRIARDRNVNATLFGVRMDCAVNCSIFHSQYRDRTSTDMKWNVRIGTWATTHTQMKLNPFKLQRKIHLRNQSLMGCIRDADAHLSECECEWYCGIIHGHDTETDVSAFSSAPDQWTTEVSYISIRMIELQSISRCVRICSGSIFIISYCVCANDCAKERARALTYIIWIALWVVNDNLFGHDHDVWPTRDHNDDSRLNECETLWCIVQTNGRIIIYYSQIYLSRLDAICALFTLSFRYFMCCAMCCRSLDRRSFHLAAGILPFSFIKWKQFVRKIIHFARSLSFCTRRHRRRKADFTATAYNCDATILQRLRLSIDLRRRSP